MGKKKNSATKAALKHLFKGTTIGGGVYSFRLHLKSKWVDGKIQVKLESGSKTRPGEFLPWLKVAENSSILNSRSY